MLQAVRDALDSNQMRDDKAEHTQTLNRLLRLLRNIRCPGRASRHTLLALTQPDDLIVDPMVGSGTTIDVCLAMGRRCYGYDIDQRKRRSITENMAIFDLTSYFLYVLKALWLTAIFRNLNSGYWGNPMTDDGKENGPAGS